MTLTINIDEEKLAKAKALAQANGETVEHVIERYLEILLVNSDQLAIVSSKDKSESPFEVSATEKIRQLQEQSNIKAVQDFDEKEDFKIHIRRKHA